MSHEKAIEAAWHALPKSAKLVVMPDDMEKVIAAFLRAWKPWDPIATRNECDLGRRLARYAADELEGKS